MKSLADYTEIPFDNFIKTLIPTDKYMLEISIVVQGRPGQYILDDDKCEKYAEKFNWDNENNILKVIYDNDTEIEFSKYNFHIEGRRRNDWKDDEEYFYRSDRGNSSSTYLIKVYKLKTEIVLLNKIVSLLDNIYFILS